MIYIMTSLSYGRIFCLESQKIYGTYQRYNHFFLFFFFILIFIFFFFFFFFYLQFHFFFYLKFDFSLLKIYIEIWKKNNVTG